jgi:hypothetical protein
MSLKDNLNKLNKLAGKAKEVAEKSGDKIAAGVDKATDKLDEKTGGKYHDKLEKVDSLAAKLDKKSDAEGAEAPAAEAPAAEAPAAAASFPTPTPAEPVAGDTPASGEAGGTPTA